MGRASRLKAESIHRKKLFDGRTNAVDLWRKHVIGNARCVKCQTARAIGTVNMFWPAADFEKDHPGLAVKYAVECRGSIPVVKFRVCGEERNFVAMPVLYFCEACQSEMEKFAAHAPSYVVSEIRTGPARDKIVGVVPS